jgi:hypothetical protein
MQMPEIKAKTDVMCLNRIPASLSGQARMLTQLASASGRSGGSGSGTRWQLEMSPSHYDTVQGAGGDFESLNQCSAQPEFVDNGPYEKAGPTADFDWGKA